MEILRNQSNREPFYRDGSLFVDLRREMVRLDGQIITLTRSEYRLLALLVEHAGEVVPKPILLVQICGYVPETRTRTLDMHIGRLRKKLGHAGRRIETIVGIGYRFSPLHGRYQGLREC